MNKKSNEELQVPNSFLLFKNRKGDVRNEALVDFQMPARR